MTPDAVVLHRGALGDSVLLWPRLRDLVRRGQRVWFVGDRSKVMLAEREVGATGIDAEDPSWNSLWSDAPVRRPLPGVSLVVDCLSSGSANFARNLAAAFPGASIETTAPPRGGDEARAWLAAHPLGAAPTRHNPAGPLVLHVGAGSPAKRWPMASFARFARRLRQWGEVELLAGEAEAERFDASELALFAQEGGRFPPDLSSLADAARRARLFIGCDSGPTHLAAQLGVPTLALFGPTEPAIWAPVGPCVRVLAPPSPHAMDWLAPDAVEAAARAFMREPPPAE